MCFAEKNMSENKKLFLLTGAGFSCGFLQYKNKNLTTSFIGQVLSDKEVFMDLFKDIKAHNLLPSYWQGSDSTILNEAQHFYASVKESLNTTFPNSEPNYEQVIYAMELITEHRQRKDYIKKFNISYNGDEWQIKNSILSLSANFNLTRPHIFIIKDFILSTICLFMNEIKPDDSGLNLISKFINKLYRESNKQVCFEKISHYTLNYDNLFQLANSEWQKTINKISYLGINQQDWPIYYLHGSILFTMEQIYSLWVETNYKNALRKTKCPEIFSSRSEDYFAHRMITGLDKEKKILDFPYDHIYNKMIVDFHSSEELWIIGYSFSDPHINSIFRQGLPRIKKIVIVDKAENANTHIPQLMRKLLFHENLTFFRNDVESSDYIEGTYGLHSKINQKAFANQLKLSDKVSNDGFEVEWHLEGTEKFIEEYLKQ